MFSNTSSFNRLIVQLVLFDKFGDMQHRMRWPAMALSKRNPEWAVINLYSQAAERTHLGLEADLLVLFHPQDPRLFDLIKQRKERKLKTLVEFGDLFTDPPISSPVYKIWKDPVLQKLYMKFMTECDAVIVTSERLAEELSKLVKAKFHVIKNHYPYTPPPIEEILIKKPSKFTFGWGGSVGHLLDTGKGFKIIEEILNVYSNTRFAYMGSSVGQPHFNVPFAHERVFTSNWDSADAWFRFLRTQVHLGIVPMEDTLYNQCRSDVKALEMAANGVLPILPNRAPYKEFIKATKIYAWDTWEDLARLCSFYTTEETVRKMHLKNCYSYVKGKRLLSKDTTRDALYSSYMKVKPFMKSFLIPDKNFLQIYGTRLSHSNPNLAK